MASPTSASERAVPARIADRYDLIELLGRGGMASVYRAEDLSTGQQVALKQLALETSSSDRATVAALFEREFYTLTQLRHPHVISVYDYGLCSDGSPYYTMELLDGGDLRDRAPLPYQLVCSLLFDVCSSLALLHSRRLLHRDISPRNIRCTAEGKAKLIDFGAMAPMSAGGGDIVGTPAFVAPETLHRLALDARTDLYSLGVTLYHALTGCVPYPAKTFADVLAAWGGKVLPPSAIVPEVPVALDDLVLSLISLEPALRPASAFSVMQQLAACAGIYLDESKAVAHAYLATPTLVGRDEIVDTLRGKLQGARSRRSAAVLIRGQPGLGRSRLLDACALEAKALGFTALRARTLATREPFAIVQGLVEHLLEAMPRSDVTADYPELFTNLTWVPSHDKVSDPPPGPRRVLKPLAEAADGGEQLRRSLCRFLREVSQTRPLLIAVDDVHRIDPESAATLAALIDGGRRPGIMVALTASSDEAAGEALNVLSSRCALFELPPLIRAQTHQLLGSIFGDVVNLPMLAEEIHRLALGNPRQSIDLAQYLVDRDVIRYAAGAWVLPSSLSAEDLPHNAAEAMQARIAQLSPQARWLGEVQAFAFYETFRDEDYRALLPAASSQAVEAALTELLQLQALVREGPSYALANRLWTAAFAASLTPDETRDRHAALAAFYDDRSVIASIHHCFSSGLVERGLELMMAHHAQHAVSGNYRRILEQNIGKMVWCTRIAIEVAQRLGRSRRDIIELRRWSFAGFIATDSGVYDAESGRLWRQQLVHDSGLDLYRADTGGGSPGERLTRALQAAQQRYLQTPEAERVYPVDEAIRLLAEYVVYAIAIGGRVYDSALLRSLPDLLEPFAALSPLLDAIWKNARGAYFSSCECRYEDARDCWRQALALLDAPTTSLPGLLEPMRNAVAYAIGIMEAQLGLATATAWADRLDRDPYQRVSALHLRKIVRLEQGDAKNAQRFQRQAEVLALQLSTPQMFRALLQIELTARTNARDLPAIARVMEEVKPLAARYPGWRPILVHAEACFHFVRGDYEAAKQTWQACVELTEPEADGASLNMAVWVAACGGLSEAQLCTGNAEQARAIARSALDACERRQMKARTSALVRVLALAEAKLGDPNAAERLDALIARQTELGVTGLRLGLSYEARAQIALWSHDPVAFQHYARLTAREYRHGAKSPLGIRYERLLNEAARFGIRADADLSDFVTSMGTSSTEDVRTMVTRSMAGRRLPAERLAVALQLICSSYSADSGHLYLMSPQGLSWRASQGGPAPGLSLTKVVRKQVEQGQARFRDMDDMSTTEADEGALARATVQAAGIAYELLWIQSVDEHLQTKLIAVAAVTPADSETPRQTLRELLQAIASQLEDLVGPDDVTRDDVTRVR